MCSLCRIISVVLSTDGADFRKQADKIERAKSGPSKDQLAAIRDYISKPRSVHEEAREHSRTNRVSMVARILEASGKPGLLASLSPSQHDQCVEYLAALLSARDRDEITRALCQQQPDLFTQTAREYMATLSPILRVVLERVDLGAHVTSLETFINDLIRISKPRTGDGSGNKSGSGHGLVSSVKNTLKKSENGRTLTPSIEDYVSLLRRNRQLLYSFLQQAAGKCTDLRTELKAWCKDFIKEFRQDSAQEQHANLEEGRKGGAGRMSGNLQSLFSGLPEDKQAVVLASLDSHADYLEKLEKVSMARMQSVLDNLPGAGEDEPAVGSRSAGSVWGSRATRPTRDAPRSMYGPGMFLSRWQDLLDVTLVAPATLRGPVRRGKDLKGAVMSGKTASQPKCAWDPEELTRQAERAVPVAPDVDVVFEALGPVFRALVGERLVRGNV